MRRPDDATLKEWLTNYRRIAVIGLSPNRARPSYGVTAYMIRNGFEIFGVRPATPGEVLGRPCVERLADLHEDVDLFDVFRNPEAVPEVVEEIAAYLKRFPARPRVLWLQEGVGNEAAEKRAESLGLNVVSDLCILKEHARLF